MQCYVDENNFLMENDQEKLFTFLVKVLYGKQLVEPFLIPLSSTQKKLIRSFIFAMPCGTTAGLSWTK